MPGALCDLWPPRSRSVAHGQDAGHVGPIVVPILRHEVCPPFPEESAAPLPLTLLSDKYRHVVGNAGTFSKQHRSLQPPPRMPQETSPFPSHTPGNETRRKSKEMKQKSRRKDRAPPSARQTSVRLQRGRGHPSPCPQWESHQKQPPDLTARRPSPSDACPVPALPSVWPAHRTAAALRPSAQDPR